MNKQTVIGIFDSNQQATNAKKALIDAGFSKSNIDVSTYGEYGDYGQGYESSKNKSKVENFFTDLFGSSDNSRSYAEVAGKGSVITVHTQDMSRAKKAAAILDNYGSIDLDDRVAGYRNGSFDRNAATAYAEKASQGKIEVVKEDLAVGKREVETGGVTVRSRIVEKPVEETLRLRQEEAYVKRTPVNRPASEADFQNQTIAVTETAEEAVVAKDARVVEEISVGKNVDSRTETVRETVRETEVDVVEKEGKTVKKHNS